MAISKIVLNNTTQIDLTDTTAIASDVASGKYFYGADGVKTVGTNTDADEIEDSNTALGNDGTASLSEAITALTTYANETTGESDVTLSDAVGTLVDGYGQGDGGDTLGKMLLNTLTQYENENVVTIKDSAFQNNTALESISFPNVTTLKPYAFSGCTNLQTVNFPKLTTLANYCFDKCGLTEFDFPLLTTISNSYAFRNNKFTGIYAPQITSVGAFTNSQFEGCTQMVYARFPNNQNNNNTGVLRQACFKNCTALKLVDIGQPTNMSVGENFFGCTALEILILRRTSNITAIGNTNNFTNVGLTNPVKVYVPSALISSYESATNWATLLSNNQVEFHALEGSPYEEKDFVYMGIPE